MPKFSPDFKYDVVQLIELVKARPGIWDRTLECYKDRMERRTSWQAIFSVMVPGYEQLTSEEKRLEGESILNKWTNVRDTFIKTLKKCTAGKPRKKYLYHKYLQFLTKIKPDENETQDTNDEEGNDESMEEPNSYTEFDVPLSNLKQECIEVGETVVESINLTPNYDEYSRRKKVRKGYEEESPPTQKKKKKEDTRDIDFAAVNDRSSVEIEPDMRLMNEDEAFFASLLPTVVNYDADDKLEFRMEVLGVMKKIREKRKWKDYEIGI